MSETQMSEQAALKLNGKEQANHSAPSASQMIKQTTIKHAVTISGVGLHTGVVTNLTFKPAPENH